jgi:hypothetical protein
LRERCLSDFDLRFAPVQAEYCGNGTQPRGEVEREFTVALKVAQPPSSRVGMSPSSYRKVYQGV